MNDPCVTIPRGVQQQQLVTLADHLTVELVVCGRCATHVQHRRNPANELLDRGTGQQIRVLYQKLSLFGLKGQLPDHRTDDRAGCLRATIEDEDRLFEDVLVVPTLPVSPQRDQVVTWFGPPLSINAKVTSAHSCITGMMPGCVA